MATTKKPGGGRRRVATSLVTLGSAVITSVYAAGYVRTQSAAEQLAAQSMPATAAVRQADPSATAPGLVAVAQSGAASASTPIPPTPTAAPTVASRPAAVATARPSPTATTPPAPTATPLPAPTATQAPAVATAAYRDGTYVGVGRSRHGNIQATVVVKGGKIVSANITGATTRYPVSWISPLPPEVITYQSSDIDYVSGATDSSMAYQSAVQQALAQARAQ